MAALKTDVKSDVCMRKLPTMSVAMQSLVADMRKLAVGSGTLLIIRLYNGSDVTNARVHFVGASAGLTLTLDRSHIWPTPDPTKTEDFAFEFGPIPKNDNIECAALLKVDDSFKTSGTVLFDLTLDGTVAHGKAHFDLIDVVRADVPMLAFKGVAAHFLDLGDLIPVADASIFRKLCETLDENANIRVVEAEDNMRLIGGHLGGSPFAVTISSGVHSIAVSVKADKLSLEREWVKEVRRIVDFYAAQIL